MTATGVHPARLRRMGVLTGITYAGNYRWLKNQAKQSARELLTVKIMEFISEHPNGAPLYRSFFNKGGQIY